MKGRLTTLIGKIHTALLELSQFEDYDDVVPRAHPPASPEQIDAYATQLGVALPPSYRAFLELHNGYDELAFPGHMLAIGATEPGGAWFTPFAKWKALGERHGAAEIMPAIPIANLGGSNQWAYLDPTRPSGHTGELTVVKWTPEQSFDYPSVVEFLQACLKTVHGGIPARRSAHRQRR